MRYSIGQVSKLLGLSAEGLRLYERMGILCPERDFDSGYRYYRRLDLTALLRARSYQQYGFSLAEIEQMLNEEDLPQLALRYQNQHTQLRQHILQKQRELLHLEWIQKEIEQFPTSLGSVWETIRPPMLRLEYMEGEHLTLSPLQYGVLQDWISMVPLAFSSLRHDWNAMEQQTDHSYSGIAIRQEDVDALGLGERLRQGTTLPACLCLCTVIAVDGNPASCVQDLAHLMQYVRQNGYTVIGDPITASILSLHKRSRYTRYRKVWLPIQST